MTDTTTSSFEIMSDDELYSFFSDFHKDVLGFRPRGDFWTRERVVEWCERETSPEAMERHQAEWKAEAEMNDLWDAELDAEWKAELAARSSCKRTQSLDDLFDNKYEAMAFSAGF